MQFEIKSNSRLQQGFMTKKITHVLCVAGLLMPVLITWSRVQFPAEITPTCYRTSHLNWFEILFGADIHPAANIGQVTLFGMIENPRKIS